MFVKRLLPAAAVAVLLFTQACQRMGHAEEAGFFAQVKQGETHPDDVPVEMPVAMPVEAPTRPPVAAPEMQPVIPPSPTPAGAARPATPAVELPAAKPTPSDADLVSLADVIPGLDVALGMFDPANLMGITTYRNNLAFLRYGTAKKLARVQEDLKAKGYQLRVWAAYRPFVVQEAMFEAAGRNPNFVSDPYRDTGKKTHVRAVAVDVTLLDLEGNEYEMPTPFLDFVHGARRMRHDFTQLPRDVLARRQLLLDTMKAHGMEAYRGEWWHYQDTEWAKYPVIEMDQFPEVHRELLRPDLLSREP